MPIRLPEHQLAYFPIPKVACTSLKCVFHELRTGEPFEPRRRPDGVPMHIHRVYPSSPFAQVNLSKFERDTKVVVVREPARRILSAYRNRVLYHWELSAKGPAGPVLREHRLPADPDLDSFIERLTEYREHVGPIRHHTEPQVTFTGKSLDYFDHVFCMERLDEFERFLGGVVGRALVFPRLQTGGPELDISALSRTSLERLLAFCAADYALLSDYYSPERSIEEYESARREARLGDPQKPAR